jgi:hypothetical protein
MDNEDTKLVLVEIKTTEALAARLRENASSLESALSSADIEVVPTSASGLKAVDPLTFSVLLAVAAKSATGAVAGLAAKELYTWLRQQATKLLKADRPSDVMVTIGSGQGISVSTAADDQDIQNAQKRIEEVLASGASSPKPKD